MMQEKCFLFCNVTRENWRGRGGRADGGEWLASDVNILISAQNLPQSTVLEIFTIQEIAALK